MSLPVPGNRVRALSSIATPLEWCLDCASLSTQGLFFSTEFETDLNNLCTCVFDFVSVYPMYVRYTRAP